MKPELEDTLAAPPQTVTVAGKPLPTTSGLAAGQQLGHFRIERPLGAGGMGEVYLGTDLALDRPVAIKVLPDQLAKDPKRRDRMVREARAQARVSHPNVGHIYFIGEEQGRLYFAMEYVPGKTIAERMTEGPMSADDALSIIRAAAAGLREAQRMGITHRDVKPSNLMLDPHGMVKVLDFGLAAGEPGEAVDGPVAQTSLAGTPLYMAPEQARGEPVDHRADIYALGATLYHLISGKPPFQADSIDELLSLHATSARPSVKRRGVPRTQIGVVDALIARMMAPVAANRFETYDDLLRAIEVASSAQSRPGGFWVRAIATSIDFLIVGLFVMGLLAILEAAGMPEFHDEPVLLGIYILYMTFTTSRWGQTFGKMIFELEVVDVSTTLAPRPWRSFRRAVIILALPMVSSLCIALIDNVVGLPTKGPDYSSMFFAISIVIGLFLLAWASYRGAGKRPLWDRLGGTLVRYRTTRTAAQ